MATHPYKYPIKLKSNKNQMNEPINYAAIKKKRKRICMKLDGVMEFSWRRMNGLVINS